MQLWNVFISWAQNLYNCFPFVVEDAFLFFSSQTVNASLDFLDMKINNKDSYKFRYNGLHVEDHCKHCGIPPKWNKMQLREWPCPWHSSSGPHPHAKVICIQEHGADADEISWPESPLTCVPQQVCRAEGTTCESLLSPFTRMEVTLSSLGSKSDTSWAIISLYYKPQNSPFSDGSEEHCYPYPWAL